MPFNVTQGSTVVITVTFFDSNNVVTVPTSANITITYPLSSNSLVTTSVILGMSAAGSFFTASWGSGVAALGLTFLSASAPGQATPTTDTLRVITP
jgi:hypothetical protein